ncbi:hypothetical protein [Actimicrobium antarcticum]|uniref:hypothetical protein n=1 Tax=Actimicrobium antarcticum TaxID=1051899 RepID=UPI0031D637F6
MQMTGGARSLHSLERQRACSTQARRGSKRQDNTATARPIAAWMSASLYTDFLMRLQAHEMPIHRLLNVRQIDSSAVFSVWELIFRWVSERKTGYKNF